MGGSTGPGPRPGPEPGQASSKGSAEDSVLKQAARGIETEGQAVERKARELLEFRHANNMLTNQLIWSARIARGNISVDEAGQPVESTGAGAGEAENAGVFAASGASDAERNKAMAVHGASALVGALLNLVWISYAGTEAPSEIYATVPILVQLIAQAIATGINNRKRS